MRYNTMAANLCFLATAASPALAFHQLRPPTISHPYDGCRHSVASTLQGGRHRCAAGAGASACRLMMTAHSSGDEGPSSQRQRQHHLEAMLDAKCRQPESLTDSNIPSPASFISTAQTDIVALVLSAMLVGGSMDLGGGSGMFGGMGSAAYAASADSYPLPATKQAALIANLEDRLMNMKPSRQEAQLRIETRSAEEIERAAARAAEYAASKAARQEAMRVGSVALPAAPGPTTTTTSVQESTPPIVAETPDAVPAVAAVPENNPPSPSQPLSSSQPEADMAAAKTKEFDTPIGKRLAATNKNEFVKFQEHTFTVTLPELNLPAVAPITVPEEGPWVSIAKGERVQPNPDLVPIGDAIKGVLRKGAEQLTQIGDLRPKQADYNRAIMEMEARVHKTVKDAEHPLFPPGIPLAPEFTSMFSIAKQNAVKALSPYLTSKEVDAAAELSIFFLVTLPVVTVALRNADANSRRPMEPRGAPPPPRILKYPNSSAKVDRPAVEEARAAAAAARAAAEAEAEARAAAKAEAKAKAEAEAAAAMPAISAAVGGGVVESAAAGVAVPGEAAKATVAAEILAGVGLAKEVATAAAADPLKLESELRRLRSELSAVSKLSEKVKALEEANDRLGGRIAELNRELSPEAIRKRIEMEEERAAKERERAEKQREAKRIEEEERLDRLVAVPERMSQSILDRSAYNAGAAGKEQVHEHASVAPAAATAAAVEAPSPAAGNAKSAVGGENDGGWISIDDTLKPKEVGDAESPEKASASKVAKKAKASPPPVVTMTGETADGDEAAGPPVAKKKSKVTRKKAQPEMASTGKKKASPDEFDEWGDDLSRALGGVRGFDLDALDLEMDDLGPEDLEELRILEREMGDLDMASLEAEFDQEDDETITNALRMAAESAMAHTSGGARGRIRTATGMSSSATAGDVSGEQKLKSGPSSAAGKGNLNGSRTTGGSVRRPDGKPYELSELEWDGYPMLPRDGADGEDEMATEGRGRADMGEWGTLSAAALKRKTIPELKGFLEERGVAPEEGKKLKKADLVEMVSELLQAA